MITKERILYIDANNNKVQSSITNFADYEIDLTVQSQYIIKCYVYDSIFTTPVIKNFQASDSFYLVLGYKRWNIDPLVTVLDTSLINQVADWSIVNPLIGQICFKLSLNVEGLLEDISSLTNKQHCMQIWCQNSSNVPYIIASCNVNIKNVAVEI